MSVYSKIISNQKNFGKRQKRSADDTSSSTTSRYDMIQALSCPTFPVIDNRHHKPRIRCIYRCTFSTLCRQNESLLQQSTRKPCWWEDQSESLMVDVMFVFRISFEVIKLLRQDENIFTSAMQVVTRQPKFNCFREKYSRFM